MQTRYEIILSAVDRGVKAAFRGVQEGADRGTKALSAANEVMNRTDKVASGLTRQVRGLVAAYVGFQSIRRSVDIITEADTAMFNMRSNIEAASREFGASIGSIDGWNDAVERLSARLTIYSKTDLRNAIAQTVDQAKHYGLAADQMEELVARAGDLSAGNIPLARSVEAITAALRGQTRQAEQLGLFVKDSYVKSWYEASDAHDKAWTSLSEGEKAQLRFQLMLEQSEEKLGSASAASKTYSGALETIKKALNDTIAENRDAADAMAALATVLEENSEVIGDMVGKVVSLTARAVEIAVEWRRVIAAFLGTVLAYSAVRKLELAIKGLSAASTSLTGLGIAAWIGKLVASVKAAMAFIAAASGPVLVLLAAKFIAVGLAIYSIIYSLSLLYEGWTVNRDAAERLNKTLTDLKKKHEEFKDVEIPADISALAREDLEKLNDELHRAQAYYRILKIELEEKSKETNIFGGVTNDSLIAKRELKDVEARLKDIGAAIREIGDVPGMAVAKKEVMATTDELETFRKSAEEAYKHASSEAEKYAGKIRDLNHGMADRERSLQDRIRDMRRKNMDDEISALDLRAHAIEKEQAAREALARYRETGADRDKQLAQEAARESDRLWSEYARGGEAATTLAIRGLERVNNILDDVDKTDIGIFEKMKTDAESAMVEITKQLDKLTEARDLDVTIKLKELEAAQKKINALIKDETKTIFIRTVQNEAHGGRVGMAKGGRFPGDSKIDSIPVMARPGEGFVRNESLKIWDRLFGTGFFEGVNNPRSAAGQAIIRALQGKISLPPMPKTRVSPGLAFAAGGRVPAMGGFDMSRMGTVDLTMDGTRYPVAGNRDVLEELERAISRKRHRRPQ